MNVLRKLNALYLIYITPLWLVYVLVNGINLQYTIATLILYQLTGLGISVGYHRMLTHRAIDPNPAIKYFLTVLGMSAHQGKPSHWSRVHKLHHGRADKSGDPHSPKDGFWHSHCGWVIEGSTKLEKNTKKAEPIDKHYYCWALVTGLLPLLWGVEAFVYFTLMRVSLVSHCTWLVNSWCHYMGVKNSLLVALLSCGEGYHANHHAKPRKARLGRWDSGWALIKLLRCKPIFT